MLLAGSAPAAAQQSATVPASSGIYTRLESVSAYYPVRGLFLGERALSRAELDGIVTRLQRQLDSVPPSLRRSWARDELNEVANALRTQRGLVHGRYGTGGVTWRGDLYSSQTPAIRIESNGLGTIDAVSHPYSEARHGWPTIEGTVATIAPTFVAAPARWVAVVAQPNASLTSIREGGWTSERFLNRAYLRARWRNLALQAGAEERQWGQSPTSSLFISGNAQPLPAISLGTDTGITLPWLLRHAGPFRFTALLSDLGASQDPPHARLAGWQASIQPWTRFELGVAVMVQTGGNGGPPATFLERLVDLFPVIDALAPQHADLQISNKLAGGNLRLRFPELSGLDVYYELQIDDFDGRRLRSSLVDDAAHLLGLRLPLLIRGRQLAWRGEWQRTSLRLYEHTQFRSGTTYHRRIIGNPLGPHGARGSLSATWRWSPMASIEVSASDERRDPAQYTVVVSGERDRGFQFVRLTDDPDHRRRRFGVTLEYGGNMGALRASVGHLQSWRTGQAGRGDWAVLLSLASHRLVAF